jgi:GGDEF domain-containing protein
MAIDVDHFKSINDRFGHDGDDVVLRVIAYLCQASKRQPDVLARIGCEEFAMLLPETDRRGDRRRTSARDHSCRRALSMASYDAMLKRADEALYEANRAGCNRVMRAPAVLHDTNRAAE